MAAPAGTQAVDRASTLLLAVIEAPTSVPFSDLVSTTGLPKSTVSRLLTSLERHGLVQRTSDSSVRPGPALTRRRTAASRRRTQAKRPSGPRSKIQPMGPRSRRSASRRSFVRTSSTLTPSEASTTP